MRKILAILLCFCALSVVFTGCGGDENKGESRPSSNEEGEWTGNY